MYIYSRLERVFFQAEENIFVFKTQLTSRGLVNFYSAGLVSHNSWATVKDQGCQMVRFQTKNPNFGKFWRALE
jgi:hypothetical protein